MPHYDLRIEIHDIPEGGAGVGRADVASLEEALKVGALLIEEAWHEVVDNGNSSRS